MRPLTINVCSNLPSSSDRPEKASLKTMLLEASEYNVVTIVRRTSVYIERVVCRDEVTPKMTLSIKHGENAIGEITIA